MSTDHNMDVQLLEKYMLIQGCMSLSTYYLEYGRHVVELRRRRRAYAPTSNTASRDNHEKINSWVSFSFPFEYGTPLGGPSDRRSSAIIHEYIYSHSTTKFTFKKYINSQVTTYVLFTNKFTHIYEMYSFASGLSVSYVG